MERNTRQLGVDTRNGTSPPFYQHQFFPANGVQPSHADSVEKTNGALSSADDDPSGAEAGVLPRHWDLKSWNWDPVKFVAQRADGRGETSEDRLQYGRNHVAFGVTVERPSLGKKHARCTEDDDEENIERTIFERETPSPPFNNGHDYAEDYDSPEAAGSLSLKLGGDSYAHAEEYGGGARNGKRNRSPSPQYQVPSCQVDACKADLSKAKDYYRRHKVCESHSKASKASVSRLMQRFCQQCSRFHPLDQFDEGKRSCRRRLAGHNRRRRKTQPDADAARAFLMAEESKGGSGLIGSLLNILSQLTGTASLVNAPVFDREALLRKAITASLEDITRTTPLWAQLLSNPHHLTSALGQQAQQLAASNIHGANSALESQRLLSSLTGSLAGPSLDALLLLLQNSLNAQIAAASITLQNNLGSQMHGASASGNLPPSSICGTEAQAVPPSSTQPTSAGVSHPRRSSPLNEVLRRTPLVGMPMQQLGTELPVQQSVPTAPSSFMPYQAPPAKNPVRPSSFPSAEGWMPPTSTFLGHRQPDSNGPSSSTRRENDRKELSSGNSQSGLDEQLPSSSSSYAERRNRTRRIAMKLFERNPEELPTNLRFQIDSWLAHLPSDMESYIRPGCLVLAIYVSMPACGWTELDRDLQGSVQRLLDLCQDSFWHSGRILVQVDCQMVLINNGEIHEHRFVDSWSHPYIQSVRPLAIEAGQAATITLKGINLTLSDTRVICAHQGKYLLEESAEANGDEFEESDNAEDDEVDGSIDHSTDLSEHDQTSMLLDAKFTSCGERSVAVGRCFVEAEHDLTLANVRPLIIADKSVCSELCTLESEIEDAASCTTKAAAREGLEPSEVIGCSQVVRLVIEEDITSFLHELGWYFQTGISRLNDECSAAYMVSATRLRCLLIFSVERSWCAVVRKLFDITLANHSQNYSIALTELSQIVQDDVSLLHRAVRRKSRGMVELLLAYEPSSSSANETKTTLDTEKLVATMQFKLLWSNLFRPDTNGPAGFTPLHIAASMQGGEDMVDALTSDPFQVGLNAWGKKRNESGQTPLDLAVARDLRSVELVAEKLRRRHQVCINIPPDSQLQTRAAAPQDGSAAGPSSVQLAEWTDTAKSGPIRSSAVVAPAPACRIHARRAHFGGVSGRAFRPFLLSLVAIATVCVCVCVVIRTPPNVIFLKRPFRWEGVQGGPK